MQRTNLRGVLYMLGAVATYSMMDMVMKRLSEAYSPMQVTFLRGAASLPFVLAATAAFGSWSELVARRWGLHLVRGALSVATLSLFVYSVSVMSLADTYTIFMCAPLLITALSVPMLGERVGWRRWVAVLVGLAGVVLVLNPSGAGLARLGGLAALASALGYALNIITIRVLSRSDSSAATALWSIFFMTMIAGVIAARGWTRIDWSHWPWIVTLGLTGAVGQHLITEAFRRAAPPAIAPLEYTALAWGMLFDWVIWATLPDARMLAGAGVIVASGLYLIHRERVTAAAPS